MTSTAAPNIFGLNVINNMHVYYTIQSILSEARNMFKIYIKHYWKITLLNAQSLHPGRSSLHLSHRSLLPIIHFTMSTNPKHSQIPNQSFPKPATSLQFPVSLLELCEVQSEQHLLQYAKHYIIILRIIRQHERPLFYETEN